jgi:catechol 2,3-dioxygenase-like lactoylglutathione lyase family enzyme
VISHVNIGISDFPRAFAFYSAVMRELGLVLKFSEPEKSWAGWVSPASPRPLFLIATPFDGRGHASGNGQMVALQAATHAMVDRAYRVAMACGAYSEGEPGPRPHYHDHYYGAYFRDLDSNKLCVCCHADEATP